nr:Pyridoxamine 5'-phosphate oxidase [uncultured bacterium]
MAKFQTELNEKLTGFIRQQKIFFTATAPAQGRINLSPKGIDTFRCLDSKTVAYLDLTGSGNETSAHLQENGRLTVMFCSFTEKPLILRLYGQGEVVKIGTERWNELIPNFIRDFGERQIIVLQIESLQTSCGFGVPIYELVEERDTLIDWAEGKNEEKLKEYWRANNLQSIDGLPTNLLDN